MTDHINRNPEAIARVLGDELPPLPDWAKYPDDDFVQQNMLDYARMAVEAARPPLLARIAELEKLVDHNWTTHQQIIASSKEVEKAEAEVERMTRLIGEIRDVEGELDAKALEVERLRGLLLDIRSHIHPDLRKRIDAALKEKP